MSQMRSRDSRIESTQLLYIRWDLKPPSSSRGNQSIAQNRKLWLSSVFTGGRGKDPTVKGNLFSSGGGAWTFAHAKPMFHTPSPRFIRHGLTVELKLAFYVFCICLLCSGIVGTSNRVGLIILNVKSWDCLWFSELLDKTVALLDKSSKVNGPI